jgi:hypothetical protein
VVIDRADLRYQVRNGTIFDPTIIKEHYEYFYDIGNRIVGSSYLFPEEANEPLGPNDPDLKFYHLPKGTVLNLTKIESSEPVVVNGGPFVDPSAKKKIVRDLTLTFSSTQEKEYLFHTRAQKFRYKDTEFILPLVFKVLPH